MRFHKNAQYKAITYFLVYEMLVFLLLLFAGVVELGFSPVTEPDRNVRAQNSLSSLQRFATAEKEQIEGSAPRKGAMIKPVGLRTLLAYAASRWPAVQLPIAPLAALFALGLGYIASALQRWWHIFALSPVRLIGWLCTLSIMNIFSAYTMGAVSGYVRILDFSGYLIYSLLLLQSIR